MNTTKKYDYIIGIDPGVNTGYAVWDCKYKIFKEINTLPIHLAMRELSTETFIKVIKVRFEDARQRKWFGSAGKEKLQGAGSIKRDCKIWEDYLTYLGVDFEMVAPKNNKTKMDADTFKRLTKWAARTSEHSRDAGMLVFGM